MERKRTVELLGKLNLTAHSTFYCFEGSSEVPAIKVHERNHRAFPGTISSSVVKKISNVSTTSKKSTISLSGGFSYLAGDVPSACHAELSPSHLPLERSKSCKEMAADDKSTKHKLRRRPAIRIAAPRKESAQFYTSDATSTVHLPQTEMFKHFSGIPPDPDVMMEGYLYKRSSNAFKTWNRRWFQIKDNKLLYSHRTAESEEPTVMEENLMLCLVRPAPPSVDRVGCFELVTPSRSHLLQADSEALCNDWMRALQRTILALHESDDSSRPSSSSKSDGRKTAAPASTHSPSGCVSSSTVSDATTTFEQIRRVPGNERCADCGSEQPKWVSINLGVVLCIECSGVHRSLGVQISKVRSLTMDSIDPELRDVLLSLGNSQVNAIYLAHLPEKDVVPAPATDNSSRQLREAWIKAKYVERRFAVSSNDRARSNAIARKEHLLCKRRLSISNVVQNGTSRARRSTSYGDGLDSDSHNDFDLEEPRNGMQSKRLSSCGSDPSLAKCDISVESTDWEVICESARCGDVIGLLRALASGADINTSRCGTTALHIATKNGQTAAVEFLLLNGAKINVLDDKLNSPLHLAAAKGNTLQVCQLLKRGADKSLKNADGVTPLEIAVEGKHADIVTLFRVHTMRDEFNEEFNNPMDDTVDSVISDITRKAAVSRSSD